MNIEILERPANSIAHIRLSAGESLTAEGGSMVAMHGTMQMDTTTHKKGRSGIGKALKRMLARESFFLNHYTASANDQYLLLAPTLNGDIIHLSLGGAASDSPDVEKVNSPSLIVEGGSFLANSSDINMDMSWQGVKNLFSGEGLFWLKFDGQGDVLANAFGCVYSIDVDGEYNVDTSHIVAFEDSLSFNLSKVGDSWIKSFVGGEGLTCKFKGKGRVWCQSHSQTAFGRLLGPMLRPRS
jgi:uncharacterized protein (TIGR00266 family)